MSTPGPESLNRHKLTWAGLIVGLLALQILMCGVATFLATSDASAVVETDYHDRALRWDETFAAIRASESLGWKETISVDPNPTIFGQRQVTIRLANSIGSPVNDADVSLTCFHHAHAAAVQTVRMVARPDVPGEYVASVPMRKRGLWEFRVMADRCGERFRSVETRDIP